MQCSVVFNSILKRAGFVGIAKIRKKQNHINHRNNCNSRNRRSEMDSSKDQQVIMITTQS